MKIRINILVLYIALFILVGSLSWVEGIQGAGLKEILLLLTGGVIGASNKLIGPDNDESDAIRMMKAVEGSRTPVECQKCKDREANDDPSDHFQG